MLTKIISTLVLLFLTAQSQAQTEMVIKYKDADSTYNLQAFEYRPAKWNGQVVIMNHGSAGPYPRDVLKFVDIARQMTDAGYIFLTYMRKGRGGSEGAYTEEKQGCGIRNLEEQYLEAEDQLKEVIRQAKVSYKVNKVFLMGHSRGGFLSAVYSSQYPQDVHGVINLVGVWSAKCEQRTKFTRYYFEKSTKFTRQAWVYVLGDTFFGSDRFGDPNYEWLEDTATQSGLKFLKYKNNFYQDSHHVVHNSPKFWTTDVFPMMQQWAVQ